MYKEEELEALLAKHADENGEVAPEVMMQILNGETPAAEVATTPGDTDDTDKAAAQGAPPNSEEGKEEAKAEVKETLATDTITPKVMAKDGEHTIPFKVVEDLREEVKATKAESAQLKQALEGQKGLIESLTKAQATDQEQGNTKATDSVFAALEEDYPGITKDLTRLMQGTIDPVKAELAPLKAAHEVGVQLTEEQKAIAAFDKSVADIEPRYLEVKDSPVFWSWFNSQPSYIQSAQTSGNPAVIADVIKLYHDSQPKTTTPASDTATAKTVADKVKEAIDKATNRPAVTSLSDLPGGTNPAHDELEAVRNMDPLAMANKFMNVGRDGIEALLNKML